MSEPTLVITQEVPATLVITAEQSGLLEINSGKGLPGSPGKDAVGLVPLPFSRFGPISPSVGDQRFYVDYDVRLLSARVSLGHPAQGAALVVGVNLDGAPYHQLSLPAGQNGVLVGIDEDIAAGSYFTIDVVSVGSTDPGEDLAVTLWMKAVA